MPSSFMCARVVVALLAAAAVTSTPYDETTTMKPTKSLDAVLNPDSVPAIEKDAKYWRYSAAHTLKEKLGTKINKNKAKNGIFFIGDGMSLATVMAARTFGGQLKKNPGEETSLAFENFPVTGLAKTYCIDAQVPDSACTATSYLTGVKTKYGTIGLDGNVTRGSCHSQLHKGNWVTSIAQWALEQGLDAGIVTTTRVTHASPAGAYAHTSERNWESDADMPEECRLLGCQDIAYQLVAGNPGRRFKVIMGGGRREFQLNMSSTDQNSTGRRLDSLDLVELWHADKKEANVSHQYITERTQFMKVSNMDQEELPEYLLGLFNDDHMSYHLKAKDEPTLEEMTEMAIRMLSRSPRGYFLFVEGGRIDHAHHESKAHLALDETVEFAKAVERANELTSAEDTLIVVSSDHAHTMSVAGYPSRGNDILGVVDNAKGEDGKPYTTLSYANGWGHSYGADGNRIDVTLDANFTSHDLDYSYPGITPLDSETHGGEDVAVFARGPWQHLFTASYEQNVVPHLIAYAMCLGEQKHEGCRPRSRRWFTSAGTSLTPNVFVLGIFSATLAVIYRHVNAL